MRERTSNNQERVLAILRRASKPLSAYDILGEMRESNPKAAPPTVYRALDALIKSGAVHRIESLNAFVACTEEGHLSPSIMTICDDCGTVEETEAPDILANLTNVVGLNGFAAERHVVEVHGLCGACGSEGTAR